MKAADMNGEEVAVELMATRGFVVIGYPPAFACDACIGSHLRNFAGALLKTHELVVIATASATDWREQERAIFPNASDRIGHPRPKPGAAFWRCELRDLERNAE